VTLGDESGRSLRAVPVRAPESEEDVDAVAATLPSSGTVVVSGDQPLPRVRLAEEARLARGLAVVLSVPGMSDEEAETMILSGRADAVAR
jgi:anthraniloyl-CoA monooxygenase